MIIRRVLPLLLFAASSFAENITIDAAGPTKPFPHFWEKMFGSGRAVLSLRESYRQDLRAVKKITGLEYVRFHAILDDENGVYSEDSAGKPVYNFSYVDQIYDGLLDNGVRPYVEISFMPSKLASSQTPHAFWYKPLPAPPSDYAKWDALVTSFAQHLIDRYGIEEVAQWYFEVWNEPNLDFWTGEPKEASYHQLYAETAVALKKVSARLRVGGPATAQAAWVGRFIEYCESHKIPLDFVSTHVYGNERSEDVFGTHEVISQHDMVARSARKVYDEVKHSLRPDLPIYWSEYNATYTNDPETTDSAFMGPWLANNIRMCDGLTTLMAYWTFSDVFEEQGVVKKPFYGGYGLIAEGGIPKAAFNAFELLHHLGEKRIDSDSDSALATLRSDGSLAIAVWNYAAPTATGESRTVTLTIKGLKGPREARVTTIDATHGSALAAWEQMGRPATPSRAQQVKLRQAAALPASTQHEVGANGNLELTLPPKALTLVEISNAASGKVGR